MYLLCAICYFVCFHYVAFSSLCQEIKTISILARLFLNLFLSYPRRAPMCPVGTSRPFPAELLGTTICHFLLS